MNKPGKLLSLLFNARTIERVVRSASMSMSALLISRSAYSFFFFGRVFGVSKMDFGVDVLLFDVFLRAFLSADMPEIEEKSTKIF